jgi:hypothetical protein
MNASIAAIENFDNANQRNELERSVCLLTVSAVLRFVASQYVDSPSPSRNFLLSTLEESSLLTLLTSDSGLRGNIIFGWEA